MKTAFILSGQMRSFGACFPLMRWNLFRHYPDAEFFVTVQDTPDCQSIDLLRAQYGVSRVHADVRTDPKLEVTPAMSVAYDAAPYENAAPPHQLLIQHWYSAESWKHFLAVTNGGEGFDTFIRIRPDQWVHNFEPPAPPSDSTCLTPYWGKFGPGCNDRLALMGRRAAEAYFGCFDVIPTLLDLGCPFHPETLLGAAVEHTGCLLEKTLVCELTTLRAPGDPRPSRAPEIMPWDLAHSALRSAA